MADNKMDIDPFGDPDRLIFLILLLLLFCPIRYRGKIKKDRTDSLREIHAFGEVSWLLHIISAQVFWEQSVLKTKLCFLGIPLEKFKNLFRKKKKPRSLSNSGNQNAKKQAEASRSMKRHQKTKIRTIPQSCKCLSLRKILLKI